MKNGRRSTWKIERASVKRSKGKRPRSNKYTQSDSHRRPAPGSQKKVWVGGHTRGDGVKVHGYFRSTPGR